VVLRTRLSSAWVILAGALIGGALHGV
jgi:hypothetical protein